MRVVCRMHTTPPTNDDTTNAAWTSYFFSFIPKRIIASVQVYILRKYVYTHTHLESRFLDNGSDADAVFFFFFSLLSTRYFWLSRVRLPRKVSTIISNACAKTSFRLCSSSLALCSCLPTSSTLLTTFKSFIQLLWCLARLPVFVRVVLILILMKMNCVFAQMTLALTTTVTTTMADKYSHDEHKCCLAQYLTLVSSKWNAMRNVSTLTDLWSVAATRMSNSKSWKR